MTVPWPARRSTQLILTEINREYSLKRLARKLQSWPLKQRANSLEKTLKLGKAEGRRKKGQQRTRWLDGFSNSMELSLSKVREAVKNKEAWHAAAHGVANSRTRLSD